MKLLKRKKIKIVFDFNIRPSRWNKKNLNIFLDSVLKFVDICFLSGEDMNYWKNKNNIKQTKNSNKTIDGEILNKDKDEL